MIETDYGYEPDYIDEEVIDAQFDDYDEDYEDYQADVRAGLFDD